jgi:uncharacterized protein YndB with AHSA1/START domain
MHLHPADMVEGAESYEHLGDVRISVMDMQLRYDELSRSRRVFLAPEEADRVFEFDYAAAPHVLWEWFNDPAKRSMWMGSRILPVLRVGGRVAPGARNHCVHGKNEVVVEDFLDIKPFDYYTVEHRPQGGPAVLRMTFQFTGLSSGGTHLTLTLRSYARGLPRWAGRLITNYAFDSSLKRRWAFHRIDSLIEDAAHPAAGEAA